MIEPYQPYLENLLRSEPWRAGKGDTTSLCPGDLTWDGSHLWLCTSCHRIGTAPTVQHFPLEETLKLRSIVRRFVQALVDAPQAA